MRAALVAALLGLLGAAALALIPLAAENASFSDFSQARASLSCGGGWSATPVGVLADGGSTTGVAPVDHNCHGQALERVEEAGVVLAAAIVGGVWLGRAGRGRVHDLSERTTELLGTDDGEAEAAREGASREGALRGR